MRTYGLRDIIGPIMVGPSSSHTAGALAIASMARRLYGGVPPKATLRLYGSFAHTGRGHGTDRALVAGLLGLAADDLAIRDAFAIADARGCSFRLIFDRDTPVAHPNTVDVTMEAADGTELAVRGVSIGGGAAEIRRIDDVDVAIDGQRTSIIVIHRDQVGVLAAITHALAARAINIASARVFRDDAGERAYSVIETDEAVASDVVEELELLDAVTSVRVVPQLFSDEAAETVAIPPDAAQTFARFDFADGSGLLELCDRESATIAQVFRRREEALCALRGYRAAIDDYLDRVLEVMQEAASEPLHHPRKSLGGLVGGEAATLLAHLDPSSATRSVLDPLGFKAACYGLAVIETNASMGRIVAAPTAGSAGVLPAVLLALAEERGFDAAALREALLTAAAVGCIIAGNATVSGAEGGCQAEVGSAAAMAAAAAVHLGGGPPAQCLAAGATVMMSFMGLVCDPIGGLVEVPCQKRNATAPNVALVCAQMALAGVENLISFDEAVAVMDQIGRDLPFELRESALGGIAATPSACRYCSAALTC